MNENENETHKETLKHTKNIINDKSLRYNTIKNEVNNHESRK